MKGIEPWLAKRDSLGSPTASNTVVQNAQPDFLRYEFMATTILRLRFGPLEKCTAPGFAGYIAIGSDSSRIVGRLQIPTRGSPV